MVKIIKNTAEKRNTDPQLNVEITRSFDSDNSVAAQFRAQLKSIDMPLGAEILLAKFDDEQLGRFAFDDIEGKVVGSVIFTVREDIASSLTFYLEDREEVTEVFDVYSDTYRTREELMAEKQRLLAEIERLKQENSNSLHATLDTYQDIVIELERMKDKLNQIYQFEGGLETVSPAAAIAKVKELEEVTAELRELRIIISKLDSKENRTHQLQQYLLMCSNQVDRFRNITELLQRSTYEQVRIEGVILYDIAINQYTLFDGQFQNGKPNGTGKLSTIQKQDVIRLRSCRDGLEGEFRDGVFIKGQKLDTTGKVIEWGEYKDNILNGQGARIKPTNWFPRIKELLWEGEYREGELIEGRVTTVDGKQKILEGKFLPGNIVNGKHYLGSDYVFKGKFIYDEEKIYKQGFIICLANNKELAIHWSGYYQMDIKDSDGGPLPSPLHIGNYEFNCIAGDFILTDKGIALGSKCELITADGQTIFDVEVKSQEYNGKKYIIRNGAKFIESEGVYDDNLELFAGNYYFFLLEDSKTTIKGFPVTEEWNVPDVRSRGWTQNPSIIHGDEYLNATVCKITNASITDDGTIRGKRHLCRAPGCKLSDKRGIAFYPYRMMEFGEGEFDENLILKKGRLAVENNHVIYTGEFGEVGASKETIKLKKGNISYSVKFGDNKLQIVEEGEFENNVLQKGKRSFRVAVSDRAEYLVMKNSTLGVPLKIGSNRWKVYYATFEEIGKFSNGILDLTHYSSEVAYSISLNEKNIDGTWCGLGAPSRTCMETWLEYYLVQAYKILFKDLTYRHRGEYGMPTTGKPDLSSLDPNPIEKLKKHRNSFGSKFLDFMKD